MPTLARINVTPVKSTALHNPDRIRLEPHGAVGNRDFFFVDEEGKRFSGNAKEPLIPIRADYDLERDHLTILLPDGFVAEGPAAANGDALTVDFYGRPVQAHVVEGLWTDALARYASRVVRLARVDRPGDATDVEPVTLVSLASVQELSRRGHRDEMVDPGRFRMLFEIDRCRPHEEDTWIGREVGIGETIVRIGEQVPRCVITTLDPKTGARDFPTLQVIKEYRGRSADGTLAFGVYARVVRPGVVEVGDHVEVLE